MASHADITRRGAISMLSATMLAAPMISAADAETTEHPDAALILLGEQLDKTWAAENLWLVKSRAKPFEDKKDDEWERLYEASRAVASEIEAMPVRTLEGLKVKARTMLWCHNGDVDDIDPGYEGQNTTDKRLTKQILLALLGV